MLPNLSDIRLYQQKYKLPILRKSKFLPSIALPNFRTYNQGTLYPRDYTNEKES